MSDTKEPIRFPDGMIVYCAHTRMVDVDALVPNPSNENSHPPEQIAQLAKIMKYNGVRNPITVSTRSGFMSKGHGRLLAAKLNGWKQFPVDDQFYENEAAEAADRIADNKIAELAEIDPLKLKESVLKLPEGFDLELLGLTGMELKLADPPPGSDEDEVPEPPKEPKTKRGELWILGDHRLLCGDSTSKEDVDRLMNGQRAAFCFTSPPYADQRTYGGGMDLSTEHLARFLPAAAGHCDLFAVNLGMSRKNGELNLYWDDYIAAAKAVNLKVLSWNIWDRSGLAGFTIGQATAMFAIEHEWIFIIGAVVRPLNRTVPNKDSGLERSSCVRAADGSITKKDVLVGSHRQLGTVFRCTTSKGEAIRLHPATFPVELPEAYVEACSNSGEIVYEPFSGSGSVLISCEKKQRKCFGMEIEPIYCDVILSRWAKHTGRDPVREDGILWSALNQVS